MDVLYEDNHCLAVLKPAGSLVQADATGDASLLEDAREYIRQRYAKPGNVYLATVHRLDRPVSGVLLLARTSKAATRLSNAFKQRRVEKLYLAVVEGRPAGPEADTRVDWLVKDPRTNTTRIAEPQAPGAREARLRYKVLASATGGRHFVTVWLETGRPHQIRVQMAGLGCPVTGDLRYGSVSGLGEWIALHAWRLSFPHPTRKEPVTVEAPLPEKWRRFGPPPSLMEADART